MEPTLRDIPPRRRGPDWAYVFVSFFLPIIGVVIGLVKAFDPDPQEKRLAGLCFGAAVAGTAVGLLLWLNFPPR